VNLGDTYLLIRGHLWVVASLPNAKGEIAFLNFTSRRQNSDLNCVIKPGEHPFVAQETVIAYERGQLLGVNEQAHVLANPTICPPRKPVSPQLLERIQNGALKSDLTPEKIKDAIRDSMAKQQLSK
jgi:hypothetical protein